MRVLCLPVFVFSALSLGSPLAASAFDGDSINLVAPSTSGSRTYLGINVGRLRNATGCNPASMLCDDTDRTTQLYAGRMFGRFWGAEVGYVDTGRMLRQGYEGRAQGLNLSLVGRANVGSALGVYGKVGTIYSRSEASVMGSAPQALANDQGFGFAFGGGVSYNITPQLSARFEWDSHDLRFGNGRDPVRATSLGLQYRY